MNTSKWDQAETQLNKKDSQAAFVVAESGVKLAGTPGVTC